MKQLRISIGIVALMLLATNCNLLPWSPYVDPQPYQDSVIVVPDTSVIVPDTTVIVHDTTVVITDTIVTVVDTSRFFIGLQDTVTIRFKSNGTTGYQWAWVNKSACASVDSVGFNYVLDRNDPLLCGGGGTEEWIFKGVKPGVDTLRFVYHRPWENVAPADTKLVVINVGGHDHNNCRKHK